MRHHRHKQEIQAFHAKSDLSALAGVALEATVASVLSWSDASQLEADPHYPFVLLCF